MDITFLKGSQEAYDRLLVKDPGTFYYTGTALYLGSLQLNGAGDAADKVGDLSNLSTTVKTNLVVALNELFGNVGNLDDLQTTDHSNLVAAINEALEKASSETGGKVTIEEDTDTDSGTYAKVYTLKQEQSGSTVTIGTINIPKDMIVSNGVVEKDPAGQDPGTYIVLTLANTANDKLYINVGNLVELYTAQANATEVQLEVNSTTREISATIVTGSITAAKIADNAITTVKIADGNVTKAKLSTELQTLIDGSIKTVTTGTTNGTISVDGANVSVFGLGSAAYKETTEFDEAGAANDALVAAKLYTDQALTWGEIQTSESGV